MEKCPLCGSRAFYAGLFTAKCGGRGCQNYEAPVQEEFAYGWWAWARDLQADGYKLEWRCRGTTDAWDELDEDLGADEAPDDQYQYRLRQDYYRYPSGYVRGSAEWAMDQKKMGRALHFNGTDYEIAPG